MTGIARRAALVVASYEYLDQSLSRLRAPGRDAEALASTLADPTIGAFEVHTCVNQPSHVVRREIARFYADRGREDLLLLYFSGHGIKDQSGRLYFAMHDTERDLMDATAIPASFVNDRMQDCRARTNLLILDCCFAGAFARGLAPKGDHSVHVSEPFAAEEPGAGRIVLTASDAMQYAFEGDEVQGSSPRSIFTGCLVEGLRSGAADLDRDGEISMTEIYDYLYDQVRSIHPKQRPLKWEWGVRGRVVLARNPSATEVALPVELTAAVSSSLASVRLVAVDELMRLMNAADRRVASSARAALKALSTDDSKQVANKAIAAMGPPISPELAGDPAPTRQAPPEEVRGVEAPAVAEAPARSMNTRLVVAAGVVAVLVAVGVVAALLGANENPSPPTATGPATTEGSTVPSTSAPSATVVTSRRVFDLRVGECLNAPSDGIWITVTLIPCTSPHVYEVTSTDRRFNDAAGTPYPGGVSLIQRAKVACEGDFAPYVGVAYDRSRLRVFSVTPDQANWDGGGRGTICMVHEPELKARTGSVRNLRE